MWMVGVRIGVAACDWASQPTGAHPREKGSFPEYWPLREGVCRAPLTGRQEKFELRFVWLPNNGEFEPDSPETEPFDCFGCYRKVQPLKITRPWFQGRPRHGGIPR